MVKKEKNRLAIKYIFEFQTDDVEVLLSIATQEIGIDELVYIRPEDYPVGWNLRVEHMRSFPYMSWNLKLIDKNERGGSSDDKYTYLLDFNLPASSEIMQFLKFLDIFDYYYYTRGTGWR